MSSAAVELNRPVSRSFTFNEWSLIALLGALSGMGPLAIDFYLPSFPNMSAEFGTTIAVIQRTLAAYFVGISIGQLIYGPISDSLGRKKPLYAGLIIFLLASIGCAVCHHVNALIGLRFLQALGGCAEMVIARAIVRDRFDSRDAPRVYAGMMLVMGVAPILAPLLGGWMAEHAGWRAVFWVLVGAAAICLAGVSVLPETLPRTSRSPLSAGLVIRRYISILGNRRFMLHTGSASFGLAALFAYVGGSPFMFIHLFHVPEQHFGLYFGINSIGIIGGSQINGQLVRRYNPHRVMRVALVVAALAGVSLLFTLPSGVGGMLGALVPIFLLMTSFGFIFPTATALAMAPMGEQAGNASSVMGCSQFLVSGIAGMIVSDLQTGTAWPMAATIAAGATLALSCDLLTPAKESVDAQQIHFEPVELEG